MHGSMNVKVYYVAPIYFAPNLTQKNLCLHNFNKMLTPPAYVLHFLNLLSQPQRQVSKF
jgi:hypothetical protein